MSVDKDQSGKSVPTNDFLEKVAFKSKFVWIVQQLGGLSKAAEIAGTSDETLMNWREGKSRPSFFGMMRLCKAAGVSLDWLSEENPLKSETKGGSLEALAEFTKRRKDQPVSGAPTGGINPELLGRVIDRISRVHSDMGFRLSEIDKGRIAAEKYREIADLAGEEDEWLLLLDLMEVRLKKALQTAINAPGQTKREA